MNSDIMCGFGRESSSTVAGTATLLFAQAEPTIKGLILMNHHASASIWVALTNDFETAPTITSTVHNARVYAGSALELRINQGVAVWIKTDGTTVNYTAKEVV
jgi:hypothetical protein